MIINVYKTASEGVVSGLTKIKDTIISMPPSTKYYPKVKTVLTKEVNDVGHPMLTLECNGSQVCVKKMNGSPSLSITIKDKGKQEFAEIFYENWQGDQFFHPKGQVNNHTQGVNDNFLTPYLAKFDLFGKKFVTISQEIKAMVDKRIQALNLSIKVGNKEAQKTFGFTHDQFKHYKKLYTKN